MTDFDQVDFLVGDESLIRDPYPYYEHLRSKCPVTPIEQLGVLAVTGHEELATVARDTVHYSSANCLAGMFPPIEIPEGCEDLGPVIEEVRASVPPELSPIANLLVSLDPPIHTDQRALLKRIFSPKRLQENEEFMGRLAERQIDEFIDKGACDLMRDYAAPFTQLVIADLLGVPESDHKLFRERLGQIPLEQLGQDGVPPLQFIEDYFTERVEERRKVPHDDVLSLLADAKYPDGSTPAPRVVATIAAFLFAAGGDTTSGLILTGTRMLCEQPELQDRLRAEPDRIPDFVEEALRYEGTTKSTFRLARRDTTIDGVDVPMGTPVMLLINAANRDPERFPNPAEFDIDRPNSREHFAFGRGPHACAGAPLARTEARVTFRHFLERMSDIRLSEEHHGPHEARRLDYEPSSVLRKLLSLHITFGQLA